MKKALISLILAAVVLTGAIISFFSLRPKEEDLLLAKLFEDGVDYKQLDNASLTFYFYSRETKQANEVADYVAEKASKLKIKLNFKFLMGSSDVYMGSIKTIIKSGDTCDAFYYADHFKDSIKSLAAEGIAKDITQLVPIYAPNYFGGFSREELEAASYAGKIYAVPNKNPSCSMKCAVIREDLLKKYNITQIKGYEDYNSFLKTIKENEPDITPMNFTGTSLSLFAEAGGYVVLDQGQQLVYKWNDPDMKLMAWEQTPEYKNAIMMMRQWFDAGYLMKGVGPSQINDNMLVSGRFASFISNLGSDMEYNAKAKNLNSNYRYKAFPLYPDKLSARTSILEGGIVISSISQNAERVLMFVEWLNTAQENYDALMYGINGKDYILREGKVDIPEGIKLADSFYGWGWRPAFRNIGLMREEYANSDGSWKSYIEYLLNNVKFPPHTGFVPDYEMVSSEKLMRSMAMQGSERALFSGGRSVSAQNAGTASNLYYFEDYIAEQSENAKIIVTEIQRQLDKWKAKKAEN